MDNTIIMKNDKAFNRLRVEATEDIPIPAKNWLRTMSSLVNWDKNTRRYVYQIPAVYRTAITAFCDYNNIRLVSKVEPDAKPAPASHKKETYEQYQLRWMSEHGHSLYSLMHELAEMQYEDPKDSDRISTPVTELFSEWEQDRGFGGEIWACNAEWEGAENKESAE